MKPLAALSIYSAPAAEGLLLAVALIDAGRADPSGARPTTPHRHGSAAQLSLEATPLVSFWITWSREKLAGFCRGGNSLKLESHCPTNA